MSVKVNNFAEKDITITRARWILSAVFLLAFILRCVYLLQIRSTPLYHFLAADTGSFERFAQKIVAGNFFFPETIYFNPLYPFFLAGVYRLFGHHLFAPLLIQAVCDASLCLVLYGICRRAFQKKSVGLIAALIYAAYGTAVFYTGIVLGASLASFLLALTVYFLMGVRQRTGSKTVPAAGFIYGAGVLIRPNCLFLLPLFFVWFLSSGAKYIHPRRRWKNLLLFGMGFVLILIPFSYRHYRITGIPGLPFGNGGFNFYVGNHPGADGTYTYLEGISSAPDSQIKSSINRASREIGMRADLTGASGYWLNNGLDFVRAEPLEYLQLLGRKFLLFWNYQEIGQNIDYEFARRFAAVTRLPLFNFGLIAPLAALGLFFAVRDRAGKSLLPALSLLFYMAAVIVFFVSSRYRLPAVPLITVVSAYGAYRLIKMFSALPESPLKAFILPGAILAGAIAVVFLPLSPFDPGRYRAWSRTMLGNVYFERGRFQEGIAEYQKALAHNPGDPIALNQLGNAYWKLGQRERAIAIFREIIRDNPAEVTALNNLGALLAESGRVEEAAEIFFAALRIDPDAAEAHNNLAVFYLYYRQDREESRRHALRAEELGYPVPPKLRRDLGLGR